MGPPPASVWQGPICGPLGPRLEIYSLPDGPARPSSTAPAPPRVGSKRGGPRATQRPLSDDGPGTPSRNVLNPGTEERELPAKCTLTVRHGDVYRHELAGAGGWGDPFARDPERVLRDVMEEKISAAYARREYGVAIDERTWTILPEETARLRAPA